MPRSIWPMLVAALCVFYAGRARAIGRIGNSDKLGDEGYSAPLPDSFPTVMPIADGSYLEGTEILNPDIGDTVGILAKDFRKQFPSLINLSREDVSQKLAEDPAWRALPIAVPSCGLALFGESASAYLAVLSWNAGKGYALIAPKTVSSRAAMLAILKGTVIEEPCTN